MRLLPREVDPQVYNMSQEDPGAVDYSAIGGLGEQVRRGVGGGWWFGVVEGFGFRNRAFNVFETPKTSSVRSRSEPQNKRLEASLSN
jgi:hypothetical protein